MAKPKQLANRLTSRRSVATRLNRTIEIITHVPDDEEQIAAVMAEFKLQRRMAKIVIDQARTKLGDLLEEFKHNFEKDQVGFLFTMRATAQDQFTRLQANKQLQNIFGVRKSHLQVEAKTPLFAQQINTQVLADASTLELALEMEERLARQQLLQPVPGGPSLQPGQLAASPPHDGPEPDADEGVRSPAEG